ncbi:hypothetical protein N7457_003502 [Penicillium paradoxum]|uniref:uncharacterized protein n=1 Tax=Penicillium paradoxum TaxID=176176 RepID=UPI002547B7C3|nr:uncharacterized protein N7457_003502 [Penicillium paradoxum]KAJ5788512.1 hypothetical protein N7457_003502 [Penicillium paradoxum]
MAGRCSARIFNQTTLGIEGAAVWSARDSEAEPLFWSKQVWRSSVQTSPDIIDTVAMSQRHAKTSQYAY